jgi:hypothetical protein
MKTSSKVPAILLQRILADAMALSAGIEAERARSVASFFTSIEEFIESPLHMRRFLSVSGKRQQILTSAEFKSAEIFRRKLAASDYPVDDILCIIEQNRPVRCESKCSFCNVEVVPSRDQRFAICWP